MTKKESENKVTIAQTAWEVFDGLGDKVLEDAVEGVASDIFSALPLGTLVIGAYKGIRNYKNKQRFQNFIVFIQSYKSKTKNEINKYLKDNPNSELGDYTLTMLEELSSPRQTEMLGRATALLLNDAIDENTFFEYGYIISKLDPHLFNLVVALNKRCFIDDYGQEDLKKKFKLATDVRVGTSISNPNQDLVSFGFLTPLEINIGGAGMDKLPLQQYTVSAEYKKFYDRIITGEKCTGPQKRK